ncbi:MAG: hypothetical protein ABI768_03995, partial [Acidobacteriota bacterium]
MKVKRGLVAFAACTILLRLPSLAQQPSSPSKKSESPSSSSSSADLFSPGPEGSRNLVVVGR